MNKKISLLIFAALLAALALIPSRAQATSGLPDSPQFGYGARIDLYGSHIEEGIDLAASLPLSWVALDFDWARHWPDPAISPDLGLLDQSVSLAKEKNLSILLSICNPAQWALSPAGPDANTTAQLVAMLVERYAGSVIAIELFPGANTLRGWGASPNPNDYLTLLNAAQAAVQHVGFPVYIFPGLVPVDPGSEETGIDDVVFISALYAAGAKSSMPIIGIRFPEVVGMPMTIPHPTERHILRHYEEVRAVMLQNEHQEGRIWITGFSWAADITQHPNADVVKLADAAAEAEWLGQAYQLLKAQLFIGAAFFNQVNPPDPSVEHPQPSLLLQDATRHPACEYIARVIRGERIALPPSEDYSSLKKQTYDLDTRAQKP